MRTEENKGAIAPRIRVYPNTEPPPRHAPAAPPAGLIRSRGPLVLFAMRIYRKTNKGAKLARFTCQTIVIATQYSSEGRVTRTGFNVSVQIVVPISSDHAVFEDCGFRGNVCFFPYDLPSITCTPLNRMRHVVCVGLFWYRAPGRGVSRCVLSGYEV